MGTASWGFSRLVSAIIIVSAVVFGLACGTIVGCLLVRLYNMQQGHTGACHDFLNSSAYSDCRKSVHFHAGSEKVTSHKVWKS